MKTLALLALIATTSLTTAAFAHSSSPATPTPRGKPGIPPSAIKGLIASAQRYGKVGQRMVTEMQKCSKYNSPADYNKIPGCVTKAARGFDGAAKSFQNKIKRQTRGRGAACKSLRTQELQALSKQRRLVREMVAAAKKLDSATFQAKATAAGQIAAQQGALITNFFQTCSRPS